MIRPFTKQAKDGPFDYCTVLLDLRDWGLVPYIADFIDPRDLTDSGIETDTHITVIYGITENDPDAVQACLDSIPVGVFFTVGNTTIFQEDDYDVVVLEIDSPELEALHQAIRETVPNEQTYDTYVPHITLAYVKRGMGMKYAGEPILPGQVSGEVFARDTVMFSDFDGNMTKLSFPSNKDKML